MEESATITARTNVDETSSELMVTCELQWKFVRHMSTRSPGQNFFLERLAEKAVCNEHCTIDFVVKVKDRTSPVYFLLDK